MSSSMAYWYNLCDHFGSERIQGSLQHRNRLASASYRRIGQYSFHSEVAMVDINYYDADLYLVGIGLFNLKQITLETLDVLRAAKSVLHISSKHLQLREINPCTEDISSVYWRKARAWSVYRRIAKIVVERAISMRPTVFAVEGTPMLCNDISWEIVRLGKRRNLHVQALPSVSCLDVLPIQLGFDIADLGTQVYEATQLVMFNLRMNPFVSTLIMQVAEFGERGIFLEDTSPARFRRLVKHLLKYYPPKHTVVFIRSASNSEEASSVFSTELRTIEQHAPRIETGMTLYLPRVCVPAVRHNWKW